MIELRKEIANDVIRWANWDRAGMSVERQEMCSVAHDLAKKCEGCGAVRVEGDRYCYQCGADRQDHFEKVLSVDPASVVPVVRDRHDDEALHARNFIKSLGLKRADYQVRRGRGTAYRYIHVNLRNEHEWDRAGHDQCGMRDPNQPPSFGWNACPYCKRAHAAADHLEALLVSYISGTENKSDAMIDYFDFTWLASTF